MPVTTRTRCLVCDITRRRSWDSDEEEESECSSHYSVAEYNDVTAGVAEEDDAVNANEEVKRVCAGGCILYVSSASV